MCIYTYTYKYTYEYIYFKGARGTERDGLLEPAHKSTSCFRQFREIKEGWVVGWFEPRLPRAETLNI